MHTISKREQVSLVIGMTCFWAYFRFQTVIQPLFHNSAPVPLPSHGVTALSVFLLILVLLSALLTFVGDQVEAWMRNKRWLTVAFAFAGALGIGVNYALSSSAGAAGAVGDTLSDVLFWISTVCFTLGFLANYLSWGHYCSRVFSLQVLALLALSFVLSLLLFSLVGMALPAIKPVVVTLIPPVTQLAWFVAVHGGEGAEGAGAPASAGASAGAGAGASAGEGKGTSAPFAASEPYTADTPIPKSKLAYILLFVIFLLCGSLIRGVVDMQNQYSTVLFFRLVCSVVLLGGMGIYCFRQLRRFRASLTKHTEVIAPKEPLSPAEIETEEHGEAERLVLKCWVFLAFVFFVGLLLSFVLPGRDFGGQLVVVARSGLDFLLWILLCNLIHTEHLQPTRTFLQFSVLVEAVSWLLSYGFIPLLYAIGGRAPEQTVRALLVLIMFLLVCALTILFAWLALRKQSAPSVAGALQVDVVPPTPPKTVPEGLIKRYKLTSREADVIALFAQGYSLAKVSQELYISLGTSQSHIKNIYRKLYVHSKNELISLVDAWNQGSPER